MIETFSLRPLWAALLALPFFVLAAPSSSSADEPLVATYDTARWTVGLLRFDQDGIDHTTATVSYGNDSGLIVYCSHETVIALRVDPFYPNGPTPPQSNIRFVVKGSSKSLFDQTLGPFTFADNSYGGAISKDLAQAMKNGSSVQLTDPTIGLDKSFPLRGSAKALSSLGCV